MSRPDTITTCQNAAHLSGRDEVMKRLQAVGFNSATPTGGCSIVDDTPPRSSPKRSAFGSRSDFSQADLRAGHWRSKPYRTHSVKSLERLDSQARSIDFQLAVTRFGPENTENGTDFTHLGTEILSLRPSSVSDLEFCRTCYGQSSRGKFELSLGGEI